MSRSFGDRKYQNLINFEPEIFQYDIANILKEVNQELPEEESVKVFLMVSCDGLYTKIADKRINEKFYLKHFFKKLEPFCLSLKDSKKLKG